ncbi:MAG: helix-turn-helix domain-containing protein [Thermoplasmata archaeon]
MAKELDKYFIKILNTLGLCEAGSILYAALAVSETPLTIQQLKKHTRYSIPRLYSLLNTLKENGLVEKIKEDHTVSYRANLNIIDLFEKRRQNIYENYLIPMLSYIETLPVNERESEHIQKILNYMKMIEEYLNILRPNAERLKRELIKKYNIIP